MLVCDRVFMSARREVSVMRKRVGEAKAVSRNGVVMLAEGSEDGNVQWN